MEILLCSLLFMVILQPCVVCGDSYIQENVSGGEGGDVILRVQQTKIRRINWILFPEGYFIVRTKPGKPIDDDEDVIKRYRGRVRSEDDGSLHMYDLSPQDQRIYRAYIQTTEGDQIWVDFNLTVYERLSPEDIQINLTITRNDPCSLGLLCLMDKRDVTITWSRVSSRDINVTQGVLYVPPSGVNFTYICTARNPVSNVSKTVIPGEYCEPKPESSRIVGRNLYGLIGILCIVLVLCILLFLWKGKKRRRREKVEVITTYDQVTHPQGPKENVYQQREEEVKAESLTLYSEVQHAKDKNPQKKLDGKKAKPVETVYSEVTSPPKENQQNGIDAQSSGPSIQSNVTDVKKTIHQQTEIGEEKIPVESVYSTVMSPKENQHNGIDAQSSGPSIQSNVTDVKKKNPQKTKIGNKKTPVESVYSTVTSPKGNRMDDVCRTK